MPAYDVDMEERAYREFRDEFHTQLAAFREDPTGDTEEGRQAAAWLTSDDAVQLVNAVAHTANNVGRFGKLILSSGKLTTE